MTLAVATFRLLSPPKLDKRVNVPVPGFSPADDDPSEWESALQGRAHMEGAVSRALTKGTGYPQPEGWAMRSSLVCEKALSAIIDNDNVSALRLIVDPSSTARLLIEMLPLTEEGQWLDRRFPIFRSFKIEQKVVKRQPDPSIAIVHQANQLFGELAEAVRAELRKANIPVSVYPGSVFSGPVPQHSLAGVLHRHKAVLFLGHSHRAGPDEGGWQLTDTEYWKISTIVGQLNDHSPVPEVVFTVACAGAWEDRPANAVGDHFYPKRFMDKSIRFFVGAWMDVLVRQEDLGTLKEMIVKYFVGWAASPDDSIRHLYEAKKKVGFPLLASLFQIYAAADPAHSGKALPGAVSASLSVGDTIGVYRLQAELWNAPYAKTFWATSQQGSHLVQVLADEWQSDPSVIGKLKSAVDRLLAIGLGTGHLLPSRYEKQAWSQGKDEQGELHILVYDRAPDEKPDDWMPLDISAYKPGDAAGWFRLLILGYELSLLIKELHARQLSHGNLDVGSLAFLRQGGEPQLILKDAWVRQVCAGRTTGVRYAAPEEPSQGTLAVQFKNDCWGLGVILYEIATGQPLPAETERTESKPVSIAAIAPAVPQVLEHVVRECLIPMPSARPDSDSIAQRLSFALLAGGNYVSEVEQQLVWQIEAGRRLFAFAADEISRLQTVLDSLARRERPRTYSIFEVVEGIGVRDRLRGHLDTNSWLGANDLGGPLSADNVATWNAMLILEWAADTLSQRQQPLPILLVHGNDWWCAGWFVAAGRLLKHIQNEKRCPVIIIADDHIAIEENLSRAFVVGQLPPASPAELFEQLLAAHTTLGCNPISADTAAELTSALYPSSSREIEYALRLCVLTYAAIDEHVIELRDEMRAQAFDRFPTVTYIPFTRLTPLDHLGLPEYIHIRIASWLDAVIHQPDVAPRRVMISGPAGCGKSSLAEALAHQIKYPLVRVEADRCLRSGLGESERALQEALETASALYRVVVLLDNIDHFWRDDLLQANNGDATMSRLLYVLSNWLDTLPPGVIVLLTAADPGRLPPTWRRRIQSTFSLKLPVGDDALAYRAAVFAALFRKYRLGEVAAIPNFMQELATETMEPSFSMARPLPSPLARRHPDAPLAEHTLRLNSAADIEYWLIETLRLHTGNINQPQSADFWRAALTMGEHK